MFLAEGYIGYLALGMSINKLQFPELLLTQNSLFYKYNLITLYFTFALTNQDAVFLVSRKHITDTKTQTADTFFLLS